MRVHLVDVTYELFRAHFGARPAVAGRDGLPLTAVAGLVATLLALLRLEGATHVGCAHDRTIRSFRNDLWPGYKTEAGMPAELLAQFGAAEEAVTALGLTLWAMEDLEADDALATAAGRLAADPQVDQVLVCTPDKDLAQVVRGERVVLRDRRRDLTYDEAGVRSKWGVSPTSIPDWLALVGDAADGFPGIPGFGARTASSLLAAYGSLEGIRAVRPASWPAGVRGADRLASTLASRWEDALLFRRLATLVGDAPIVGTDPASLEWRGAAPADWEAFCERWGLDRLRTRPHRWRA